MPIPLLKPGVIPNSDVEFANRKIEKLNAANWFAQVGKLGPISKVTSWDDALRMADYSDDYPYGDYLQALANDVRGFAASQDRAIYNKVWGKGHDAVSKPLAKFLSSEVYSKIPAKQLSNYVKSGISGALINQLALALVYGMNHPQLEIHVLQLTSGHFPCGYNGEYPSGSLVVF